MLAALAGAAAGGVAVALWETIGPGTGHAAASGRLTGARPSTAKPGTAIWRAKVNSPVRYLAVAGGVVLSHQVFMAGLACGEARRKNAASFRELMSWVIAANSAPGNISAGINCAGVLALAEECARGAGVNACWSVMTIAATAITASALPPNGTIHQVRRPGRGGGPGGTGLVPDEAGSRGGGLPGRPADGCARHGRPAVVRPEAAGRRHLSSRG